MRIALILLLAATAGAQTTPQNFPITQDISPASCKPDEYLSNDGRCLHDYTGEQRPAGDGRNTVTCFDPSCHNGSTTLLGCIPHGPGVFCTDPACHVVITEDSVICSPIVASPETPAEKSADDVWRTPETLPTQTLPQPVQYCTPDRTTDCVNVQQEHRDCGLTAYLTKDGHCEPYQCSQSEDHKLVVAIARLMLESKDNEIAHLKAENAALRKQLAAAKKGAQHGK